LKLQQQRVSVVPLHIAARGIKARQSQHGAAVAAGSINDFVIKQHIQCALFFVPVTSRLNTYSKLFLVFFL
jgi:hypothetical protein